MDAGSESDLAADVPTLRVSFAAGLGPQQSRSVLFFAPAGPASSALDYPSSAGAAGGREAGAAKKDLSALCPPPGALWSATVQTWVTRSRQWGSIEIPDIKLARALAISQQTLLMMTESQPDGRTPTLLCPHCCVLSVGRCRSAWAEVTYPLLRLGPL